MGKQSISEITHFPDNAGIPNIFLFIQEFEERSKRVEWKKFK